MCDAFSIQMPPVCQQTANEYLCACVCAHLITKAFKKALKKYILFVIFQRKQ